MWAGRAINAAHVLFLKSTTMVSFCELKSVKKSCISIGVWHDVVFQKEHCCILFIIVWALKDLNIWLITPPTPFPNKQSEVLSNHWKLEMRDSLEKLSGIPQHYPVPVYDLSALTRTNANLQPYLLFSDKWRGFKATAPLAESLCGLRHIVHNL